MEASTPRRSGWWCPTSADVGANEITTATQQPHHSYFVLLTHSLLRPCELHQISPARVHDLVSYVRMAVITEIPGVKVTVEVDGVLSQEYEDADGPSSDKSRKKPKYKCYKYIQSSDDAHFSVVYEVDNHNERVTDNALALYLFVDGEQMDSTLWEASRFGATGGHWRHPVTGTRATSSLSGMDAFRKFKFSKITTSPSFCAANGELPN